MSRDLCIMACIFCREAKFQEWVFTQAGMMARDPATAQNYCKEFILEACDVKSRNDLDTNQAAATLFHAEIRVPFLAWKEQQELAKEHHE